jgi:hypothetical protein
MDEEPDMNLYQPLQDVYNMKHDMEAEEERRSMNEYQMKSANAKLSANTKQVGGNHYQTTIQPWDFIIANNLGYLEGNVVKYVSRWKDKGGVQDLEKARHYLDKLIETVQK